MSALRKGKRVLRWMDGEIAWGILGPDLTRVVSETWHPSSTAPVTGVIRERVAAMLRAWKTA